MSYKMDTCLDLDTAWNNFQQNNYTETNIDNQNKFENKKNINCTELYISTKTKISYLNNEIDLNNVFWKIPIINYYHEIEGVVKKEMKFNSLSKIELNAINLAILNAKKHVFFIFFSFFLFFFIFFHFFFKKKRRFIMVFLEIFVFFDIFLKKNKKKQKKSKKNTFFQKSY